MAKDFWDDIGDAYDPFGVFDDEGDGHDRGEALEAADFEDAVDEYERRTFGAGGGADEEGEDEERGADGAEWEAYEALVQRIEAEPCADEGVRARRLDAAFVLCHYTDESEDDAQMRRRSRFILENKGLIAADYCTSIGFEIGEAVWALYPLPGGFAENYGRETDWPRLYDNLLDFDLALALRVWVWAYEQFAPYAAYDRHALEQSVEILLYDYKPDVDYAAFRALLFDHCAAHPGFARSLPAHCDEQPSGFISAVRDAVDCGQGAVAKELVEGFLAAPRMTPIQKVRMLRCVVADRMDGYFSRARWLRDVLLPMLRAEKNELVQRDLPRFERAVQGIFEEEEEERRAAEEERRAEAELAAWEEELRAQEANAAAERAAARREREEHWRQQRAEEEARRARDLQDETEYHCFAVYIDGIGRAYSYRAEEGYRLGERVVVPVGEGGRTMEGTVVGELRARRIALPCPPEQLKSILRRA